MPEHESVDFVLGTDFGIYHGETGTLIAAATDNQMQETTEMIAVSNKQSGSANQYLPGRDDGSASGTSRILNTEDDPYSALHAIKAARLPVMIKYSSEISGSKYWEVAEAYISELSRTDPDNDSSTVNYTFQFSSPVEEKTIAA